ncbi:MAG: glycosyl hydrolase [Thermoanaerobaculia bacterium]
MSFKQQHIKSQINRGALLVSCCLCLSIFWNVAVFAENPYGVAGSNWSPNSSMIKMGMPAESQAYIWDGLQVTNDYVMVRPCDYWLRTGRNHQAHGYHEDSDTIDNPVAFGQWVANNPGKVWIIGNEPDEPSQDALTLDEYARMFRTYYQFVRDIDPSARFAIGAFSGVLNHTGHQWAEMKHWYESVLTSYQLQNGGQRMPIDSWNTHTYYGVWNASMTPNALELMNEMIDPFIAWVRTVDSGYYKDSEIIITEFGIAGPGASGRPKTVTDFMESITAILDKRVDAFFWFYGAWTDDPNWTDSCLIGPDGNPTDLGWHYSTLANIWQDSIYPWDQDGVTTSYITESADRLTVINKNMFWNMRRSDRHWVNAGRFADLPSQNPWSAARMPKVDGKTAWEHGVTAAYVAKHLGWLSVISKDKYWNMRLADHTWVNAGRFADLPSSNPWSAARMPKVDGKNAWEHGITASFINDDTSMMTIISKDKYWNMRLADRTWVYFGRFDALPSHNPWSAAQLPKVDGKNAWQHGITAGYIVPDLGLLSVVSGDKYWNMRLADHSWVSAGKYSDLPLRHAWRQAPKVLP